jgi:hypothetical protein
MIDDGLQGDQHLAREPVLVGGPVEGDDHDGSLALHTHLVRSDRRRGTPRMADLDHAFVVPPDATVYVSA